MVKNKWFNDRTNKRLLCVQSELEDMIFGVYDSEFGKLIEVAIKKIEKARELEDD